MTPVLGIDFDNTIISYSDILFGLATERRLIDGSCPCVKRDIRDRVRMLPNGEIEWQKLQAAAYGEKINEAVMMDDVSLFLKTCNKRQLKVYIVSHKTQFASMDLKKNVDLRDAAINWMSYHGFFERDYIGLEKDRIYFASTRAEKIRFIAKLCCSHFVDDLEETFLEPAFPTNVHKILYAPEQKTTLPTNRVARSWKEINDYFFRNKN